jgi:carboxypeptidase C (cathepsin A)
LEGNAPGNSQGAQKVARIVELVSQIWKSMQHYILCLPCYRQINLFDSGFNIWNLGPRVWCRAVARSQTINEAIHQELTMAQFFQLSPALATVVATFVASIPFAEAQYPPPPTYDNVLKSPINPNVTISYKQPDEGTCTTVYPTQKQYTGYISLPPYTLAPIQQNYSINTFFWFVEARQVPESAPLTIWLNGGPGSSSMVGLFTEVGPCEVVQMNDGSYGTQARMWGWDRSSNMLFIDQPNQVGFSYDTATNASYDLFANEVHEPAAVKADLPSFLNLDGTFGTANSNERDPWSASSNTTEIAASATWHFLQSWLSTFPQYNPAVRPNITSPQVPEAAVGIHLFTESYGGKYGPTFARHFDQQSRKRRMGLLPSNDSLDIQLESLGIINGIVDDAVQDYYYPFFAYNNTYGIKAYSQTDQLNTLHAFSGQGGCLEQIDACRAAANATDPNGLGDVAQTNDVCKAAQYGCLNVTAPYVNGGYDVYDIRQKTPSPDPPAAYQEYLNNETVLESIGARVNYTESNPYVQQGFISTGDTMRGGQLDDLAYLLSGGVRVALMYGDADFICNWLGGQAISLEVAQLVRPLPSPGPPGSPGHPPAPGLNPYATAFPAAGYADIVVNSSYVGGAVRQFGNLSFSRIYDAGHLMPYYQPETAFTVFTRIIQGTELSTGDVIDLSTFGSEGPQNATHTNKVPAQPAPTCWVRAWNSTCTTEDTEAMLAGNGIVANGIFYQDDSSVSLPQSSVRAGIPGSPMSAAPDEASQETGGASPSIAVALTGVYTATNTPSPSEGAASAVWRDGRQASSLVRPGVMLLFGFGIGVALFV